MTPAHILLVEDEALIATDLEERLRLLGYEVVGNVDTGAEAVRQATLLRPDLLLMDIRLKGPLDGIQAAAQIRQDTSIPIVFLTAHADDDTLQRAGLTEPFGYLVKPFGTNDLHATIETALHRYQAEARLQRMERWLATTLQSIGDGVLATDRQGRITFLNPVAEHLTGWTQREAMGRPWHDVFQVLHAETRERLPDVVTQCIAQGTKLHVDESSSLLTRQGREIPIDDSIAPIRDDDGAITGVVIIFRDRSERQRLEAERRHLESKLREAQKFESLGVLAGGIAHDFNNLLTVMLGHAELCQASLPPTSPLQPSLQQIVLATGRAAELCTQLLAYAGSIPFTPRPLEVNALVSEVVEFLKPSLNQQATLHLQLDSPLPAANGDAGQLQQLLRSLLSNASEALEDRPGHIALRTGIMHPTPETLRNAVITPEPRADTYVFLEVSDTGCGMSDDLRQHIFDPFFSTKFPGRGLGLAAVLGIVRRHQGALLMDSTPGRGSTFRVLLPIATMPPTASHSEASAPWRGVGRILIVDDDPLVREVAGALLASLGFEPIEASSGREALALCQAPGEHFVAVLLDLTMFDMDGAQTLSALRQLLPTLPVLLMSGYSAEAVTPHVTTDQITRFLPKPFAVPQLRDMLQALLGDAASPLRHGADRPSRSH